MKGISAFVLTFLLAVAASAQPVDSLDSATDQSVFKYSDIEFMLDLPAAYEAAGRKYDGDLFVYFYRAGDPRHAKMDSLVFSDERLSSYVNDNFAAFAADVETETGSRLLAIVRPGDVYDSPFIAVVSRQHSSTVFFYGWDNVNPWLDDHGLDGNGQHWISTVSAKEFGAAPSRPGEEGWGTWSARVQELISNNDSGR